VASRDEIVRYADELLLVERFPEFGRPGLQVLGAAQVTKIACGVSASLELFRAAAASGAQLVLVHHGIFWRNEPLWIDRRQRGRLEALFAADLTLVAYHLALDAHPELGNNARLAAALGVQREGEFGAIGLGGRLPEPIGLDELVERIRGAVDREPLVFPHGPDRIERVAISTGAAGGTDGRRCSPWRTRSAGSASRR
jgi:putative NIF3 family GTP cyclohydrolase 1 type 2